MRIVAAPDSTIIDPEGHRVAWEDERVRVVEVRLPVGKTVALHSHPPRIIVAITAYRLRLMDAAGVVQVADRQPGDAVWSEGEEHTAEVLAGPVHAVELELKGSAP